ncbi:MAG: class I SAM-dependent methyltransferase [Chloroflexi bacterium]|nr:class I SAM-dependent methyltransferase [Chloroflexota bacterium]
MIKTNVDFPWPTPPGFSSKPVWTGHGFQIGNVLTPILSYQVAESGWTDALTEFHEDTAGANHFIDRASRCHALDQLRHVKTESPVILEIGCSSGFMLRLIREHLSRAFVIGSDYVCGPLERLAENLPDVPLLQFDLVTCPLPDESIDAVILLNVLEHIGDDSAAMRQVYRILKPGGIAVIEVPANQRLYDVYDKLLMHHRRYAPQDSRQIVMGSGFQIIKQSHLGFFLYPGFWLIKMRNKRFLSAERVVYKQIVSQNIRSTGNSRLFDALMRLELTLGNRVAYPFGIRCLVTCIKATG